MSQATSWVLLVLAGLLEIGWAIGLKLSDGFSLRKPLETGLTVAAICGSMVLLATAAKGLPIGTAYAVWVGIGAAGTAAVGMLVLGEPATAARIGAIGLIVAGVVALKLVS